MDGAKSNIAQVVKKQNAIRVKQKNKDSKTFHKNSFRELGNIVTNKAFFFTALQSHTAQEAVERLTVSM